MSCVKAGECEGSRLRRNTLSLAHAVSYLAGTSVARRKAGVQGKYSGYRKAMSVCLGTDVQEGAQDLPGGSVVKTLPANAGDKQGLTPGLRRSYMPQSD